MAFPLLFVPDDQRPLEAARISAELSKANAQLAMEAQNSALRLNLARDAENSANQRAERELALKERLAQQEFGLQNRRMGMEMANAERLRQAEMEKIKLAHSLGQDDPQNQIARMKLGLVEGLTPEQRTDYVMGVNPVHRDQLRIQEKEADIRAKQFERENSMAKLQTEKAMARENPRMKGAEVDKAWGNIQAKLVTTPNIGGVEQTLSSLLFLADRAEDVTYMGKYIDQARASISKTGAKVSPGFAEQQAAALTSIMQQKKAEIIADFEKVERMKLQGYPPEYTAAEEEKVAKQLKDFPLMKAKIAVYLESISPKKQQQGFWGNMFDRTKEEAPGLAANVGSPLGAYYLGYKAIKDLASGTENPLGNSLLSILPPAALGYNVKKNWGRFFGGKEEGSGNKN